ncbi:MAG: DegT/DnrJ/EryC1/StrS family aminotransferase [Armatimonadota bacterium]
MAKANGDAFQHLINLDFGARELRNYGELEMKYLKEVLEGNSLSSWIHPDSMTHRFEEAFAKKIGAKAAMGKTNAQAGLVEAVSVSGAGPGYEVICDPVVHFAGLATVCFNAVPRFADIKPDTYNMDPESLLANITPLTKAVIVTHLWGQPAEIDTIAQICKEKGLFLIEDCAHGIGATWNDKHVGTFGDIGVFSFQDFKQLSTGDGGMSVTVNEDLFEKMRNAWWFSGESPRFLYLNYRMNETTAAVGMAQLEKVDAILAHYSKTLDILNKAIEGCEWLRARTVRKEAHMSGYWWACTWRGDEFGLSYDKFKEIDQELGIGLRFGFNQFPAQEFPFFRESTAYRTSPDCPIRCPLYTAKSNYRYTWGLTPVCEDLMPRFVTVNLVFLSTPAAEEMAEKIQTAIKMMEK